jgi:hypothetical protein
MELDMLLQRFESCCRNVKTIQDQNPVIHRDCVKMVKSTQKLLEDVSRAGVECRRLNRLTLAYQTAINQATESVANLERYVMMAKLMV